MSILISDSASAAHYLKQNQANLQGTLKRLSSGKRITGGGDDPGGLAISMKMNASIKRLAGAENNVQNGISYLEVQDGLLETAGNLLTRISELYGLYSGDPLKATGGSEQTAMDAEFTEIKTQFTAIAGMTFNSATLFGTGTTPIGIDAEGTTTLDIKQANLAHADIIAVTTTAASLADLDVDAINAALEQVASLRSANGSGQNRLNYTAQSLSLQRINMTAALGRVEDVDLATESANLAKHSIMTQASAAMVAQANSQNDIALMLLN
jgi:flagellin